MADLTSPAFTDETAAREALEAVRWPNGPHCPHCGNADPERIRKLEGKSTRPGVYKCRECEKPFSVTVGTVYERSHIPLHKWLFATHLMAAGKKGISAHQIHRMLGITYKSAWFMCHRIREAMAPAKGEPPLGGEGKEVEADETFIGKKRGREVTKGAKHKQVALSLVERGGNVRSFKIDNAGVLDVERVIAANVDRKSHLKTDEARYYGKIGKHFASHETVNHSRGEYGRGRAYTNTLENYFSVFKRGMKGVYQHCDEKHLQRYLAEFDFRYNNRAAAGVTDSERAVKALKGIGGKRLTYRRTDERPAPASLG